MNDRWTYEHPASPLIVTNQTAIGTTINDPQPILNLCRQGASGVSYEASATFKLCRYENSGVNSRTRMDIVLSNNRYDEVNYATPCACIPSAQPTLRLRCRWGRTDNPDQPGWPCLNTGCRRCPPQDARAAPAGPVADAGRNGSKGPRTRAARRGHWGGRRGARASPSVPPASTRMAARAERGRGASHRAAGSRSHCRRGPASDE